MHILLRPQPIYIQRLKSQFSKNSLLTSPIPTTHSILSEVGQQTNIYKLIDWLHFRRYFGSAEEKCGIVAHVNNNIEIVVYKGHSCPKNINKIKYD